ncbi:MAG: hypothetical protein KDB01_04390 [Planctomycetaceae bacterium]|nr:hypothetical protein [Planctomycetaceae bacterium]
MASAPSGNAPAGPKVSSVRTAFSLILLLVVLVICVIEVRAGFGQFLTNKAFTNVSQNNMFQDVTFADAQGMLAAFPSESPVEVLATEDVHHYQWFSLLRPLMGGKSPEMFVTTDHSDPPKALTFYTSTEDNSYVAPMHPPTIEMGQEDLHPETSGEESPAASDAAEPATSEESK